MSSSAKSNSPKVPVIIAGTGHGLRVLAPALRSSGFEVVAVVGNEPDRTRRRAGRAGVAAVFTDLDQAIRKTGAAAVAVATTPHTHAPLVHTALEHGCHVLCEKPFAIDSAEARAMLDAAQRSGVVHLVGNQFRLRPERVVVGEAIKQGLIGEPRLITIVQYTDLLADPEAKRPQWWFDSAQGGGWLGASGSHMIDMIRTWLGEFRCVSAALPIVADRKDVAEDTFSVRFTMENGTEGMLMQTAGAWGDYAAMTRVAGTKGTLAMTPGKVSLMNAAGSRELPIPAELELPVIEIADRGNPYLAVELPPALLLCEAWHNAILGSTRRNATPLATFEDGLASMRVIDAIRASAGRDGIPVEIA